MYRVNSGALGWAGQLFAYYRLPEAPLPPETAGLKEAAAYLNENTPLILVPVTLDGAWQRTLSCPLLLCDQAGLCRAVLPDRLGRACWIREDNGRKTYVTQKNSAFFGREGYAVQRDLPAETPGLRTALGRLAQDAGFFETAVLLLWCFLGGGLLLLLSMLLQAMLDGTGRYAGFSAVLGLAGIGAGLLCLLEGGRRMLARICRRSALGLLPALGERIWFAAGAGVSAEPASLLARLQKNGEALVCWLLLPLCGAGVWLPLAGSLAAISVPLVHTAALLAAGLLLAAAAVAGRSARHADQGRAEEEYRWLMNRASDRRFGVARAFPFGRENAAGWPTEMLWMALPLFMTPVLFAATGQGLSPAKLAAAAVLYVPAVVFPMMMLDGAARAGRTLAGLRRLLRRTGRKQGHERELPEQGSALELKNVTFTYPGRREPVLTDVDLRVFPGEVLGIVGKTGAGKTTLARLMAGLLRPDAGQVYYGGIEMGRYERESVLRRIAFENGGDIRLLEHAPEALDGRTTVIFSTRAEELACCERVFELSEGRLIQRARAEK